MNLIVPIIVLYYYTSVFYLVKIMKVISHPNDKRLISKLYYTNLLFCVGFFGLIFYKRMREKNIIGYYEYICVTWEKLKKYPIATRGTKICIEDYQNAQRVLKLKKIEKKCGQGWL